MYVNALMFMTITAVMWFVFNDFISVWFHNIQGGSELIVDNLSLALILIVFLVNGMRRITITFREAQGLYWYDRYKPIFESVINLAVSIVLAVKIGLPGVFVGTLTSVMATSFWVEPYVLYKYGFGVKLREYFKKIRGLFYCRSDWLWYYLCSRHRIKLDDNGLDVRCGNHSVYVYRGGRFYTVYI